MHAGDGQSIADRVATGVTYVLSPPVLPPLLVWLVLRWAGAPPRETALLTGVTVVFLSFVPAGFLVWMVRSGRSGSVNLDHLRHRAAALAIGVAGALAVALTAQLALTGARALLLSTLLAYLLTSVLLILVNRTWRISLHAASIGGFLSVVLFVAGLGAAMPAGPAPGDVALTCIAAAFLVGWARLRLRAHTPAQVVAGALAGLIIPYLTLVVADSVHSLAVP